jgi:hypothetical protein
MEFPGGTFVMKRLELLPSRYAQQLVHNMVQLESLAGFYNMTVAYSTYTQDYAPVKQTFDQIKARLRDEPEPGVRISFIVATPKTEGIEDPSFKAAVEDPTRKTAKLAAWCDKLEGIEKQLGRIGVEANHEGSEMLRLIDLLRAVYQPIHQAVRFLKGKQGLWECDACSFWNPSTTGKCGACDALRAGAGAGAGAGAASETAMGGKKRRSRSRRSRVTRGSKKSSRKSSRR